MLKRARRKVVKHVDFQGLDVSIEFPKGSKREYFDDQGKQQFKTMSADYGEVAGTKGLDGDPVDIYLGPNAESQRVFVITQMKKNDWDKVDEEKVVLGVTSKSEARRLYLKHYNDTRFCGAIKELSMDQFLQRLTTKGMVGKKIASAAQRIAEINYMRKQAGLPLLIQGAQGQLVSIDMDKLAAEGEKLRREVRSHLEHQLLGAEPELDGVPAVTAFGELQPGQKVAALATNKLERLMARRHGRPEPAPIFDPPKSSVTVEEQRGLGIPESRIVDDPKDSKMRKAAALAREQLAEDQINRLRKVALSERGQRISDRIDDVGIATLASPYVAQGLAKRLAHRPGRLGTIGKGLQAYHDNFPSKNRKEIAGLALVAPGITHTVANAIDKRAPGAKLAGILGNAGRKLLRVGAAGTLLAGAGVGAGAVGAKRLMAGEHHGSSLSPPSYVPPRVV